MHFGFFEVFRVFFLHVLRYEFETWYVHAVSGVTRQVRVSFQSGHFDFTAKNRSKSFICIHGFKNYIEASDLVHTQIVSVLTPVDFCHAWAIFGPLVDNKPPKGCVCVCVCGGGGGGSRASSQRNMRFEFHQNQVSAFEEFSGLFSKCFAVSTWKLVYTLSRLHNILRSCFTRMGSLWPSSCS